MGIKWIIYIYIYWRAPKKRAQNYYTYNVLKFNELRVVSRFLCSSYTLLQIDERQYVLMNGNV